MLVKQEVIKSFNEMPNEFSIDDAIKQSAAFNYSIPKVNMEQYKEVIGNFIASRFSL